MQFAYQDSMMFEPTTAGDELAAEMGELSSLAPLLAGARARGVADAFEMMGLAAVFIDATGAVLHVGRSTLRFLGGDLAVVSKHLVTKRSESNRALQEMIESVVSTRDGIPPRPIIVARSKNNSMQIRAIPVADEADDEMQLLKAVIVIEERPAPAPALKAPRKRRATLQLGDEMSA